MDRVLPSVSQHLHEQSVAAVEHLLAQRPSSSRVTDGTLRDYSKAIGKSLVAGWETQVGEGERMARVAILLDRTFPFSLPVIRLLGDSRFGIWPHIERTNVVCAMAQHQHVEFLSVADLTEKLLKRTADIVEQGQIGGNDAEFARELQSYWCMGFQVLSANIPNPDAPCALNVRTAASLLLACDEAVAGDWFKRLGAATEGLWEAGHYLPLTTPILPRDFPTTVAQFRQLLSNQGIADPLKNAPRAEIARFFFVLGVPDTISGGRIYLGLRMDARSELLPLPSRKRDRRSRALRRDVAMQRGSRQDLRPAFPGSDSVRRFTVTRCDGSWIHSRGGTGDYPQLRGKRVIVIGCGSLGSSVAVHLAKAGAGTIALFDPDTLTWGNGARHELGGIAAMGRRKDAALAKEISSKFPHLVVQGELGGRWQEHYHSQPAFWKAADLIVTTTADWASDSELNLVHRHEGVITCPILYGFVEAHASAGQAVLIDRTGPCYQCGVANDGAILGSVFTWDVEPLVKEPACGAFYQPYGSTELAQSAAMIARVAIHQLLGRAPRNQRTVWIGDSDGAIARGAKINPQSGIPYNEAMAGYRQIDCAWPALQGCPTCGSSQAAPTNAVLRQDTQYDLCVGAGGPPDLPQCTADHQGTT